MNKWFWIVGTIKEFFEMKRHERRGAIVVLALIAVLLAATCVVRCSRESVKPVPTVDIRQFEAEADSATVIDTKPSSKKKATPKTKRRHSSPKPSKPSKPAPAPRRLDPVPQI